MVDGNRPACGADRGKALFCQLRLVPVAFRHLRAGQAEFARHAGRKESAPGITDIACGSRYRSSDGDLLFVSPQSIEGGTDSEFCRSVPVDDPVTGFPAGRQLLAAHHQIIHGQLRRMGRQLHAKKGRRRHAVDLFSPDILFDRQQILSHLLAENVDGCSHGERASQIIQGSIKSEAAQMTVIPAGRDPQPVRSPGDEMMEGSVTLHNPLRRSRRTRSINHVGIAVVPGEINGSGILPLLHHSIQRFFCQRYSGAGVTEHELSPVLGIGRIQRKICRSCLHDTDHRNGKCPVPADFHCYEAARSDTRFDQAGRNRIRFPVKFPVAEAAGLVHHRSVFGIFLGGLYKEIHPGFILLTGYRIPRRAHRQLLLFLRA